jgi:hypothetical protein
VPVRLIAAQASMSAWTVVVAAQLSPHAALGSGLDRL